MTRPRGSPGSSIPLVATKLEPPPLPRTYVDRKRLTARLSSGADEACELTLVSAPPGYGKSLAVSGWISSDDRPHAWLTLDAGEDDPVRLIRYVAAALGRVRPGIGPRTVSLLGASGVPPTELVVATLLDEVAASDVPFTLVLDDCHALRSDPAQRLVARLVAQAPPFVQIVLVTRQDPRLPLARLRAHGRLVEIRADDLRYSATEATTLLAALGVTVGSKSVEALVERTEGWVAGLQLAALTLQGRPDADSLVGAFGVANRYLIDYLADEVLASIPDELRSFLERTSVADRLCGGLADALTGGTDGERTLREVEERNLFLLPLDGARSWYRYHNLFADYLRARLDAATRRECLLLAARWCDGRGLAVEAARYALASERWVEGLPIIAKGSHAALEGGEPASVLHWAASMPPDVLATSGSLLADKAWAAFFAGEMSTATAAAADLARLDDAGRLEGQAGAIGRAIRAWLAVLDSRPEEGRQLGALAVAGPIDDPFFRSLALLALADACWDLGGVAENAAALEEAIALARGAPPTLATSLVGYVYAVAANEQGRRPDAEKACCQLVAASQAITGVVHPTAGPLRVGLGMAAYESNDLVAAAAELEAGFAMCRRLGVERLLGGESRRARAMVRLASAGADSAREAVAETTTTAAAFLARTRGPAAGATAALVAQRCGDSRQALRWVETVLGDPGRDRSTTPKVRLHRDLAAASILLHAGARSRAETIALEAGRLAAWTGSVLGQVQASIIAATAAEQRGGRADARTRLSEAVTLAAPGGYVRRFVEDGASLVHLLPTVRSIDDAFVDRVLAAIDADVADRTPRHRMAEAAWQAPDGGVVELLTQRELDVLRLLALGRSNAGIAASLGMSAGTAKWHVANVLGKLNTRTRGEATARARELGLV